MQAGDRVLGYILERALGEGGMGTVYLARHTVLDQQVAIKALSPVLARDEALRMRFIQEANIQAKLRHPGIVQVLTAEMEGEQPSLVMEYVDGKSLSEVLKLRGVLPVDDALKIMINTISWHFLWLPHCHDIHQIALVFVLAKHYLNEVEFAGPLHFQ